jgi:hypothetical protein
VPVVFITAAMVAVFVRHQRDCRPAGPTSAFDNHIGDLLPDHGRGMDGKNCSFNEKHVSGGHKGNMAAA